ncbi:MAG TPA: hypothetical protein VGM05_19105 [Planctomycetaceae bacterium]
MDVIELRRRVREKRTFSDAVEAFFLLALQPELIWRDLLDGLEDPGLIAETSVIRLHSALDVPLPPSGWVFERGFWEQG